MMRNVTGSIVLLAVVLAGCGGGKKAQAKADARAERSGFTPPSVTSRLDYGGNVERRFRALDRNGDEAITPDELPRVDSKLMRLDRNGDGKITATEWSEGLMGRFDAMDRNHDSSLTSDERAAMANMADLPAETNAMMSNAR